MSGLIERCRGLIQSRGWWGLIRFVLRSVVRKSQDIVFDKDLGDDTEFVKYTIDGSYLVSLIQQNNINDLELLWLIQQALAAENSIYREGLNNEDCLLAITLNGKLIHTSFVQFDTSYKKILNEVGAVPLIGNCWTAADCRGQGLYPYAINQCCKVIAARGIERILISCAPDNIPSIAGIEKAGFRKIRTILTYLVLTKFILQRVTNKIEQAKFRVGIL